MSFLSFFIVFLSLFLFLGPASAQTINGPSFIEFTLYPTPSSLNPDVFTSQKLILEATATNFSFIFSLANPSLFTSDALTVVVTAPLFTTPNITLTAFSTAIYIPLTTPTPFTMDIFLLLNNASCTVSATPGYCNNTYVLDVVRGTLPQAGNNDWDILWIIVGVLGFVLLVMLWLNYVAYRATRARSGYSSGESARLAP